MVLLLIAGFLLILLGYIVYIRPWIMRMGATDEEIQMPMPGDELMSYSNQTYTQAITINAPPELVWAYLVQVGCRRAGWYNWDFINGMSAKDYFYENGRSANRVIPELQKLQQGDKIYLTPQINMDVHELLEKQLLVLTGEEDGRFVVVWTYMLKEIDENKTRLIVRWTSALGEGIIVTLINKLIVEPGGVGIQQPLMLRGIRKRAEEDLLRKTTI
ncbi:MAG: hypothetical protein ACM3PP_10615 [Candidatus Saccharibacteria bacterium]